MGERLDFTPDEKKEEEKKEICVLRVGHITHQLITLQLMTKV